MSKKKKNTKTQFPGNQTQILLIEKQEEIRALKEENSQLDKQNRSLEREVQIERSRGEQLTDRLKFASSAAEEGREKSDAFEQKNNFLRQEINDRDAEYASKLERAEFENASKLLEFQETLLQLSEKISQELPNVTTPPQKIPSPFTQKQPTPFDTPFSVPPQQYAPQMQPFISKEPAPIIIPQPLSMVMPPYTQQQPTETKKTYQPLPSFMQSPPAATISQPLSHASQHEFWQQQHNQPSHLPVTQPLTPSEFISPSSSVSTQMSKEEELKERIKALERQLKIVETTVKEREDLLEKREEEHQKEKKQLEERAEKAENSKNDVIRRGVQQGDGWASMFI